LQWYFRGIKVIKVSRHSHQWCKYYVLRLLVWFKSTLFYSSRSFIHSFIRSFVHSFYPHLYSISCVRHQWWGKLTAPTVDIGDMSERVAVWYCDVLDMLSRYVVVFSVNSNVVFWCRGEVCCWHFDWLVIFCGQLQSSLKMSAAI
jgi:hypothetical protein